MKFYKTFLVVVFFGTVALAGPQLLSAQSHKANWQNEWDKTIDAAKREGRVVVSVPTSAELRKEFETGFQKKYPGIDLELNVARGASNINKIVEEDKAGVRSFDLHIGGTTSIVTGPLTQNLLEPIPLWMLLPEVRDAKNWWGGHIWIDNARKYIYSFTAYITETLWYNSNLVKPEEITSYDHLLDPKWKGKIAILDPRTPGSGESTWGFCGRSKGSSILTNSRRRK